MLTITLGMDAYQNKQEALSSGDMSSPMFAQEVTSKPRKSENLKRTIGWVGTLNFSHKNIYLLDLSYRLDGSSEFGTNKTYAPFFSVGTGINLHRYAAFSDSRFLTNLKLTGTYGRRGSQNFSAYAARHIFEIQTENWYETGMGILMTSMGNPDLKWQVKDSYDIGLQANFFRGLISLNFGYYYELTKDMVSQVTIPTSFGFRSYYDNVGKAKTWGMISVCRPT